MFTFLKAQTASLMASVVDFLLTVIFVELFGWWYVAGTTLGTLTGGLTHFTMGRNWVFKSTKSNIPKQLWRYILVWNGSILLNVGGVFIITHYLAIQYIYSKIFTSLLVGYFYNYLFHKKYVFK